MMTSLVSGRHNVHITKLWVCTCHSYNLMSIRLAECDKSDTSVCQLHILLYDPHHMHMYVHIINFYGWFSCKRRHAVSYSYNICIDGQ